MQKALRLSESNCQQLTEVIRSKSMAMINLIFDTVSLWMVWIALVIKCYRLSAMDDVDEGSSNGVRSFGSERPQPLGQWGSSVQDLSDADGRPIPCTIQ